jgi:hypothetical protein
MRARAGDSTHTVTPNAFSFEYVGAACRAPGHRSLVQRDGRRRGNGTNVRDDGIDVTRGQRPTEGGRPGRHRRRGSTIGYRRSEVLVTRGTQKVGLSDCWSLIRQVPLTGLAMANRTHTTVESCAGCVRAGRRVGEWRSRVGPGSPTASSVAAPQARDQGRHATREARAAHRWRQDTRYERPKAVDANGAGHESRGTEEPNGSHHQVPVSPPCAR